MNATRANKATTVIDEAAVSKAILAIESTEPTPEELEAEQLDKLISVIRKAIHRGDSHDKIRKKIRSAIPKLHYKKIEALFAAAAEPASDQRELANQTDQTDQLQGVPSERVP